MDDGKLFSITRLDLGCWEVYAGTENTSEDKQIQDFANRNSGKLGQFGTLHEAKDAIVDDFSTRDFPEYKSVWYGTKWGNIYLRRRENSYFL